MIVTLIIPFDDGFVDIDGHVSGGIRTITGKLTEQQLEELLVEPAYAGRAIQRKYTLNGEFVSLRVTFNNDNVTPDHVLSSDSTHRYEGQAYYDSHPGFGKLAYETRYVEVEAPPGQGTYTLTSLWTQPSEGSSLWLCYLSKKDVKEVKKAIAWLKEHAGDVWGHELASWDLQPEDELAGTALWGADAVLAELKVQSRYEEDPNFYGPDRYPPFEII